MFGEVDPKHFYGKILYEPLTSTEEWEVTVIDLTLGKESLSKKTRFLFNSGRENFVGPELDINNILKIIKATKKWDGIYIVECNQLEYLPNLNFQLASQNITFTPGMYIKQDGDYCVPSFRSHSQKYWIAGIEFFQYFYTVFDYDFSRIGFAEAQP